MNRKGHAGRGIRPLMFSSRVAVTSLNDETVAQNGSGWLDATGWLREHPLDHGIDASCQLTGNAVHGSSS
jgi:hypothetical protein